MEYPFSYVLKHNDLANFIRNEIRHHYIEYYGDAVRYVIDIRVDVVDLSDKVIDIDVLPLCLNNMFYEGVYRLIYDSKHNKFLCPINVANETKYMELLSIMYKSLKALNDVDESLYKLDIFHFILSKTYRILFPSYSYYEILDNEFSDVYNLILKIINDLRINVVEFKKVLDFNSKIDAVQNRYMGR